MANIITAPESGIYFDGNTGGYGNIPSLTGDASGVAIQYDGYAGLKIASSATGANYQDRFSVEGANGRLFGVSDAVTGTVFSVNDAAGLPIIEVESTSGYDKITIGEYGTDALVISGSSVKIGGNAALTGITSSQVTTALGYTPADVNDTGSFLTDYTVTQADVTQYSGSLSITESQISDLQSYLTSVSQSDVTQYSGSLSITESQISDLQSYLTSVSQSDVTQHQAALTLTSGQVTGALGFSPISTDNNTFRTVTAGGNTLGATETLAFTAGSNITITENAGAVTIAASINGGNATTLDSLDSTSFLRSDADDTLTKVLTVDDANGGNITYDLATNGIYIPKPQGANYATTTNSHTGGIAIKLPTTAWTYIQDMVSFHVDIYDYAGTSAGESVSLFIFGHCYSNGNWANVGAHVVSDRTDRDYTVRFGQDGTRYIVYIGETTTAWNYLQVNVRDFHAGFGATHTNYDTGWDIAVNVTSFSNVQQTSSANYPVAKQLKTARTITLDGDLSGSASFDGSSNITISGSFANDSVGAAEIAANAVGASELNVAGDGTSSQFLRSDGDGTFSWATPSDTDTNYYLNGITKNGNTLTFSVSGASDQSYTFGSNAFNSTAFLTTVTEADVTGALGYTPISTDNDTTYTAGNGLALSGTQFRINDPANLSQLTEGTDATDDKFLLWDESASLWKYMTMDDLQDSIDTNTTYSLSSFGVTAVSGELNVLDGITATTTELNYTTGLSSNIQSQLDGKSPTAGSTSLTTVGTIATGVWQGSVIASAYLDSDTAHLSGTQTFTGTKIFEQSGTNALALKISDGTSFLQFVPNLGNGGYTQMASAGDIGLIFSTDDSNTSEDTGKGLVIAPWSDGRGLKIDDAGNVGIGTTSPAVDLHVSDDVRIDDQLYVRTISSQYFSSSNSLNLIYGGAANFTVSSNATERFRIDSSGNVGIGTTSPSSKLDIFGTSDTYLTIRNNGGGYDAGIRMYGGSAGISHIWHDDTESNPPGINFGTSADVATAPTSQLYIKGSDGNVGIGTTSPNYKLQVHGNVNVVGTGGYIRWNSGDIAIKNEGSYKMGFQTYNATSTSLTTKMVLDTDGNVGIGTTSPAEKLEVYGNILLSDNTTGSGELGSIVNLVLNADTDGNSGDAYRNIIFQNRGTETARIDSSGKVGIGTNSPSSLLHLESASSPTLQIKDTTNNVTFKAYAQDSNSHLANTSNHDLYIDTNSVSRIAVKADGKVGIGTTGPARRLDLGTTGQMTFGDGVTADSTQGVYWHSGSNYGIYRTSGSWTASDYQQLMIKWVTGIVLDPGSGAYNKSHVGIVGGLSVGTAYYSTESNNNLIVQGDVGIGTTSPAQKLTVQGANNTSAATFKVQDTDSRGILIESPYSGFGTGYIGTNGTNSSLGFKINNVVKAKLDTSGNLGIGTITPSYKLDVNGTLRSTGAAVFDSTVTASGALTIGSITAATTDLDKFLVSDSGVVKYRTGAQVLSDIGGLSTTTAASTYLAKAGGTMSGDIDMGGNILTNIGRITSTNVSDSVDIIGNIPFIRKHDNSGDYLSSIDNLSTFILSKVDGGYGGGTKPTGSHNGTAVLSFQTHTGNYFTQLALSTNTNDLFIRSANNATSYGSWAKIWNESDFTDTNISNWNTAYGWGNHASQGYLTAHPTIGAASSSNNSGRTYIQDITLDGNGHVTGITTATETVTDTNTFRTVTAGGNTLSSNETLAFTAGSNITITENAGAVTIAASIDGGNATTLDSLDSTSFLRSDADDTTTGTLTIGDGSNQARLKIQKADNNQADHIEFYNGTTRIGEIGCYDSWLRINQHTTTNIYTPRYIRADSGFFVDGTSKGINGSGNFIGGTIAGASDANVANWDTAYGWGNHASQGYLTAHPTISAASSSDNSGRTYIQDITLDSNGHVTGITTATETVTDTNTFRTVTAGGNTLSSNETLAFVAGSNVTITENAGAVTIASTDTTYTLASFGITSTSTELNYTDGVTSNIQTQLDAKASSTHTHALNDLSGVTISSVGSNEVLSYNGAGWVNRTLAEAGIQAAGTYNTVIGTDSDINTSGETIIDNIYVTDGVITSMGTRTLTASDISALTQSDFEELLWQNTGRIFSPMCNPLRYSSSGTTGALDGVCFTRAEVTSTANAYAQNCLTRTTTNEISWSGGGTEFSRKLGASFKCAFVASGTTSQSIRFMFGGRANNVQAAGSDPLVYKGFGVEIRSVSGTTLEWRVIAHNGTTFSASSWSNTPSNTSGNYLKELYIYSDGAGNISAGLDDRGGDGSSWTTKSTTGGPTGNGNSTYPYLVNEVINAASGSSYARARIYDYKIFSE